MARAGRNEYACMDSNPKEKLLGKKRNEYASMDPEAKEELLAKHREYFEIYELAT